jgi:hypothetical protein
VLTELKNSAIKNAGKRCRKKPRKHCNNCADSVENGKNVHRKSTNKFSKTETSNSRGRGKTE